MSSKFTAGALAGLAAAFAALYLFRPRVETRVEIREVPHDVVQVVTKEVRVPVPVIRDVVKEMPVERIIQVDRPIPANYRAALDLSNQMGDAAALVPDNLLKGVPAVNVVVTVQNNLAVFIDPNEMKAAFELALSQNGIPVRADAASTIYYSVSAMTLDEIPSIFVWSNKASLRESGYLFGRTNGVDRTAVATWEDGHFGYTGAGKIHDQLMESVRAEAEKFSDSWLRSNQP